MLSPNPDFANHVRRPMMRGIAKCFQRSPEILRTDILLRLLAAQRTCYIKYEMQNPRIFNVAKMPKEV